MPTLLLALLLANTVAEGDQHFAARADAAQANAALAAYQRAVQANPNDLEARWKLLRAYRFKGAYLAKTNEEKKKVYGEAKKAGDEALALVARVLQSRGIADLQKASEKQIADAARAVPGAGEVFLWDAVNWGEWALAYGKLAAVKEGAADRIKRGATIALLIDPRMEGGTPPRVLGRLHDQTPRVPFVTGWASSKEAVRFLQQSLKIDPANKITKVFLAEALGESAKDEAIRMLREVVNSPNNPLFAVEDAAAQEDARKLLRKWGA